MLHLVFSFWLAQTTDQPSRNPFELLRKAAGEAAPPPLSGGEILPLYLGNIVLAALSLLGVIFFALTVYGGFLWLTASGNKERVDKAKKIIQRAAIGFLIVLFAGAITQFVLNTFAQ